MDMEQKFCAELVRALDEGKFKNELALCRAAGINQGGLNKFLNTLYFKMGRGKPPPRLKENLNLDIVSKLVGVLGGKLVFPDDIDEGCLFELEQLRQRLRDLEVENARLREELIGERAIAKRLEGLLERQMPPRQAQAERSDRPRIEFEEKEGNAG